MQTEFARQRAQPGQIVIGADSHTCSAGGMGALAIGLGAGDVTLPLVTGHTWLQARGGGAPVSGPTPNPSDKHALATPGARDVPH